MALTFEIAGQPVAKGRPRISRGGIAYTPAKTRKYEDAVRYIAGQAMAGRPPLDEALAVTVTAIVPIPASWSLRKRNSALVGALHPTSRPDVDNFAKAILDGCNAIVWRDDSLVVDLIVRKRYGDRPRLAVIVERIADCAEAA